MWELTDDKAFFSPIIWADGDATESWSNICFSFSLSVEIVLKADFKVKYTTKIVKKNYRNDTICRSKCRTIQCIPMKTKNTEQAKPNLVINVLKVVHKRNTCLIWKKKYLKINQMNLDRKNFAGTMVKLLLYLFCK